MRVKIKKINWEALSVISAMILFTANIYLGKYDESKKSADEVDKINLILSYEVESNHNLIFKMVAQQRIRESTFKDKICFVSSAPVTFITRSKDALNSFQNDIFKTYLDKLSTLPSDELSLLIKLYNQQSKFISGINETYYSEDFIKIQNEHNPPYENGYCSTDDPLTPAHMRTEISYTINYKLLKDMLSTSSELLEVLNDNKKHLKINEKTSTTSLSNR